MKFVFLFAIVLSSLTAFSQKQGLRGQVFWVSGNQMPGPESVLSPNQGTTREIVVYELTTIKDATQIGPFFRDIKTKFVASILSKPDGSFKIKLAPGSYSVFTKEKNGFYANLFDDKNNINPVVVRESEYPWLTITIDYEATY
ncbi:MAG: carboxypeptidase regulatory-like domain-containing protein [Cyclobacteriaceae bacterium]|nr:carboxypeptidase regulatory-like domain-containing protein [Cyclobacteriaceae bacterium]